MDRWRQADEPGQAEIRTRVIAHAIQYHLVTRFTSLVAVEEVVVNPSGQSGKAAVPTELPAEIRTRVIAHAIQYHLVTRFTSLVAVEEVVVNPSGQSGKAA